MRRPVPLLTCVLAVALAVVVAALLAALSPLPARAQDMDTALPGYRLLMVEQPGCNYCRVFNRDIAPVYDVSPEGRAVPLIRSQLRDPAPVGVTLASRPYATPTFILIDPAGAEVGRMVGYLGDDFFWPYLTRMFDRAGLVIPAPNLSGG